MLLQPSYGEETKKFFLQMVLEIYLNNLQY